MPESTSNMRSLLPIGSIRQRYSVSNMTIWRWIRHRHLGFPKPLYIGRHRFWVVEELEAWECQLPKHADSALRSSVDPANARPSESPRKGQTCRSEEICE